MHIGKIGLVSKDSVALVDCDELENLDPGKTVYNMSTKTLSPGESVLVVLKDSGSLLIVKDGELCWVFAECIDIIS